MNVQPATTLSLHICGSPVRAVPRRLPVCAQPVQRDGADVQDCYMPVVRAQPQFRLWRVLQQPGRVGGRHHPVTASLCVEHGRLDVSSAATPGLHERHFVVKETIGSGFGSRADVSPEGCPAARQCRIVAVDKTVRVELRGLLMSLAARPSSAARSEAPSDAMPSNQSSPSASSGARLARHAVACTCSGSRAAQARACGPPRGGRHQQRFQQRPGLRRAVLPERGECIRSAGAVSTLVHPQRSSVGQGQILNGNHPFRVKRSPLDGDD